MFTFSETLYCNLTDFCDCQVSKSVTKPHLHNNNKLFGTVAQKNPFLKATHKMQCHLNCNLNCVVFLKFETEFFCNVNYQHV